MRTQEQFLEFCDFSDVAKREGRTQEVYLEINGSVLEGYVYPDTDFEGSFILRDKSDGTKFKINGWLCDTIEQL